MWILILLFGLATMVLAWTLFAYFLLIWFVGLFRPQEKPTFPEEWPRLSIVVPTYNEIEQISQKLANLRALDYPRELLEVVFVDGGSNDGTVEWLEEELVEEFGCRVERSPLGGKIQQLNHVLPSLRGEIVVNTDADALLETDAARWLAAEFASQPEVWLVGAYCRPTDTAYRIDRYYWDAQNKARFMEARAATASIVVAPCYAFRRELLDQFPDDVVADDIYIAFVCHLAGKGTIYSRYARAVELRNPHNLSEFLPHKFRKANAFLRECLRFLYRLPEMSGYCRMMLVTRISQQLFFPWALAWWLLLAGSLLTLYPDPRADVVIMATLGLFILFAFTSRAYRSVKLPEEHPPQHSLVTVIKGWVLTTLILLTTGLSYPFYRQNSTYARLSASSGEVAPTPETAKPEAAKSEAAKSEATQSEATQSEAAKSEATQSEAAKSEVAEASP